MNIGDGTSKAKRQANVQAYFNRAARSFDSVYDHQRTALMQAVDRRFRSDMFQRFDMALEAIEPLAGKTVLDVGCGSGPYVVAALRRGAARVLGLDLAPAILDLARERVAASGLRDGCELRVGAFPDDAPEETFDVGIAIGVLDYVDARIHFLEALASVTRLAVLSFPSKHWFRGTLRHGRYWAKRCPLHLCDQDEVASLMAAGGFKEVEIVKLPGAGMDYFVKAAGSA